MGHVWGTKKQRKKRKRRRRRRKRRRRKGEGRDGDAMPLDRDLLSCEGVNEEIMRSAFLHTN